MFDCASPKPRATGTQEHTTRAGGGYLHALAVLRAALVDVAAGRVAADEADGADLRRVADEVDRVLCSQFTTRIPREQKRRAAPWSRG
jgi:hypothetical protein